jgi:transposase
MRLVISKSKNSISYYVNEAYRNAKGVSTSRIFEKLGTHADLQIKLGQDVDVEQWCRDYVDALNKKIKDGKPTTVKVSITPDVRLNKDGNSRSFNVGYCFLQNELDRLGITAICKEISSKYKFQYNFEQIFCDLICARILAPNSKLGSYEYAKSHFLQKPEYELEDVYRALSVIDKEDDLIQQRLFENSAKDVKRNTDVLFYDCTNFFFESSDSGELKRFGKSKENRPNPIVQMGLFMDGNGIPLGYSLFAGNKNEQPSLKPLEQRIIDDFALKDSRMIICTDAGLASTANRQFNSIGKRDFITISPIKKMKQTDQDWVLNKDRSLVSVPIKPDENPALVRKDIEANGWRVAGGNNTHYISLEDIDENEDVNKIFYKEKILVDEKTKFEQRLIVTYSVKYKNFLEHKRENDVTRAQKLIAAHNSKKLEISGNKDIRQYIKTNVIDKDGNAVKETKSKYELDTAAIEAQAKYDGFYAVCTSLSKDDKSVEDIIEINKGRWEIEESFRIMKTEFKSRPVFVRKDEHIKAHFNTCFVSLLVYRLLEHKILAKCKDEHFTASQITKTLREMNITPIGSYYTASFKRTELTDIFHDIAGKNVFFDCEYISAKAIRNAYKNFLK